MKKILFLAFMLFVSTEVFARCRLPLIDSSGELITPPCPTTICPSGMFMGDDGKCYSCDEEKDIAVDCIDDKISEICPNRIIWGCGYSRLCPKNNCPSGTFIGDDGKCYNCDEDEKIDVNCLGQKIMAELCPNRGVYDCVDRLTSYKCPSGGKNKHKDGRCCWDGEFSMCEQQPLCMP